LEDKYQACKNKGEKSWNEVSKELGMGENAGEKLRCWYKRERRRKNDFGKKSVEREASEHKSNYVSDGDNIFVTYIADHVPTVEEVMKRYEVNPDDWKVEKFEVTDWQMGRKDIQKDITFTDGVADGFTTDSGKINRVWLHRINVKFIRKAEEIRSRNVIEEMIEDAKNFAPVYTRIEYPSYADEMLYEIAVFDAHLGRLAWREESGADYDLKIAEEAVYSVVDKLLSYGKGFPIKKILLPWGNDLMNVDGLMNTTTKGTPQSEDTRWQKTFRKVREITVNVIDKCSTLAPVDVLIIAGNHDRQRTFYLGDALESWYHNNPNVCIDNTAKLRKYYLFGKNLIGFTHGSEESLKRLPLLMPLEVPDMWAKSTYREWHTGDKHKKFDTNEEGVVIRILRALAAPDSWTASKGFNSLRASESFLWQCKDGLLAQFTATPK
jgi:hypothetical protein